MIVTDLLPTLKELSRADKLRVMLFLITELAKEEGVAPLEKDANFSSVTLYNSFEAAQVLGKMLEEHNQKQNG
jgi:hypothetical protein